MGAKVPVFVHSIEAQPLPRNEYHDSLVNMFVETVRVHQNFCTYERWDSTDYIGPYSEIKTGFLNYRS